MCGEKLQSVRRALPVPGSPPRVRGKVRQVVIGPPFKGITPACAGKRSQDHQGLPNRRDHPRVCGEKSSLPGSVRPASGSPPRVRGKEKPRFAESQKARITPACAGKSVCLHRTSGPSQDHPRVCGEKKIPCKTWTTTRGSPPRVRGKADLRAFCVPFLGITPACAGKRLSNIYSNLKGKDHPRVCGEKSQRSSGRGEALGSPPRVRGKV